MTTCELSYNYPNWINQIIYTDKSNQTDRLGSDIQTRISVIIMFITVYYKSFQMGSVPQKSMNKKWNPVIAGL